MRRSSCGKIVVVAVALWCAAIAVAEGESPATSAGRDGKAIDAADGERQRKTALKLPVLTVRQWISGKQTGVCSFLPMEVSVSGGQSPLRISFSDDTPNGSGATIRDSLWTAALVAALQKESALQGVRISLDFKGGVDGPSAGAVMCLGIMTALDGREFPDDFAMTGTILPDGTVGLVGGVAEKLKAAAKEPKIKRVAIPAFQRFEKDANENWVDLFELGRELGLSLCPVASIGDAYCFLHREKISRPAIPTALSVVRESAAFEANAAEVFKFYDVAVKRVIVGSSSALQNVISEGLEWEGIDRNKAERRFEEGAIFDALDLITRSAGCVQAALATSRFYLNYMQEFEADESKKSIRGRGVNEWPIETQLEFVDGFRKEVADFCEVALGWKNGDDDKPEDEKTEPEEPWFGIVPEAGASDLDAQLLSLVEDAKAVGLYRYLVKQTFNRADLKKAIQEGDRDIYAEIDYDKKKLFFLMSAKLRVPGFYGVSIPTLNAGQEVSSALELFRKAWTIADGMIESEVVDSLANNASVHKDAVREHLIGNDCRFAVYDVAKRWGKLFLSLYDDAIDDGDSFGYPSYTDSTLLFICADLFAEASAQMLSLDKETENASFAAFVTDRARASALLGMEACRNAGIPCFGSVLAFQKAERSRAERSETVTQILADYWKATMSAKALLMAFKNGKGPKQGFTGYQLSEESVAAKRSMEAVLQAMLNADIEPIVQTFPATWVKNVSDSAAVFAEKSNDEEWNAVRDVLERSGRLLVCKNGLFAELIAKNRLSCVDRDGVRCVVANWGEKLIGISRTASREAVANGRLVDILMSPLEHVEGAAAGLRFPMPKIDACQKTHNVVEVSVSDWGTTSPTLIKVFSDGPYLFRKMDGKMVLADMPRAFKDCTAWKSLVASEVSKAEKKKSMLTVIRSISDTLRKAMDCADEDSLKATLGEMDLPLLFQGFADRNNGASHE